MDLLESMQRKLSAKNVSVVEFAESPNYCDKEIYPRQRILLKLMFLEELEGWEEDIVDYWIQGGRNNSEIFLSPDIRERIQFLRDRKYNHFPEVQLVGGRRSSKGFTTAIATTKIMWDAIQLGDPGKHYGVDPKKEIYFSCIAASEDQAKQYQFSDLVNTIESCKPIKEEYLIKSLETEVRVATPADLRAIGELKSQSRRKQVRDIARLRGKAFAANAGTIRGNASMVLIFDEMAHMLDTEEGKASASKVYEAAKPSLDQFGRATMIFLNSSPYSKVGRFFEKYTEGTKEYDSSLPPGLPNEHGELTNGNPYMLVFQFPSWGLFENYREDFRKHPSQFREAEIPPKSITVSPNWDPEEKDEDGFDRYVEEDKESIMKMKVEEAGNPDTFKVERRGRFAEVEDAYLNPEMVDRMYSGAPAGYEEDKIKLEPVYTNLGQEARVIYNYVAHLDPSSTTAGFGFALGHVEKFKHKDGKERDHVIFDIIKRWEPKNFEGGAIIWEDVLEEVISYIEIFLPSQVSFDQFQSDAPMQWLSRQIQERGFSTQIALRRRQNESNWKQAETFKTALYHGFVHAPNDTVDTAWSNLELKFLVRKKSGGKFDRVDKQDLGPVKTKDMADCIMEVTEVLIGNLIARNIRDMLSENSFVAGAFRGYQIGGVLQGVADAPELSGYYQGGMRRQGEQLINAAVNTRRGGRRGLGGGSSSIRGITRSRKR